MRYFLLSFFLGVFTLPTPLAAETGHDAWLRYAPVDVAMRGRCDRLPAQVVALGDSVVIKSAQAELIRGVRGMLGRTLRAGADLPKESAIVLGTVDAIHAARLVMLLHTGLREDGYWLTTTTIDGFPCLLITALNDRGVLYGVFALLRRIALGEAVSQLDEQQVPYAPVRWSTNGITSTEPSSGVMRARPFSLKRTMWSKI